MPFKHGRLAALYLGGNDVSPYFASADWAAKMTPADVTTFGAAWKSAIAGLADSTLTASGYYDSAYPAGGNDAVVQATLQVDNAVVTYLPAGGLAIGDQARLILAETTDLKRGSKIGGAITFDWAATTTQAVGFGTVLHVLQSETGTISGTGDGLLQGVSSATGLVANLHVTAISGGTLSFKLQDSVLIGGAYTDIASGAFTNVTAIGAQRLVVPGTIRAFVRAVATLGASTCTYSITAART